MRDPDWQHADLDLARELELLPHLELLLGAQALLLPLGEERLSRTTREPEGDDDEGRVRDRERDDEAVAEAPATDQRVQEQLDEGRKDDRGAQEDEFHGREAEEDEEERVDEEPRLP